MSETLSETTSAARSPVPRHFLRAQHHRQLTRLVNEMCVLDDIVALERHPEKEPQC
jgi:hypothetical protein